MNALCLSTCLIYLILYLLLLFSLAHIHGVTLSVAEIAICPRSCGVCGWSANSLLGNIVLIQRCEVNTKKCNVVKSSVIFERNRMIIQVWLDCKWHRTKGILPLRQHRVTHWPTMLEKVFALLWMIYMTDKKRAFAPGTPSAETDHLNLTQLRDNNFLR